MKRAIEIPLPRCSSTLGLAAGLCASLFLAACGGGGGGDSPPSTSVAADAGSGAATATASSDGGFGSAQARANATPAAASTAPGSADGAGQAFNASYFPITAGATWLFDAGDRSNLQLGRAQISIANSDGHNALFQENDRGALSSRAVTVDGDGVSLRFTWGQGSKVMALNPRLYSFGGYAVGQTRSVSGSAFADVDGDMSVDRAEYQLSQVLVGYDDAVDLPVKGGVAHFRNVLTVRVSQGNYVQSGETRNEDVWLAPGLGPVKIERSITDLSTGQTTFGRYTLVSAQVGARTFASGS